VQKFGSPADVEHFNKGASNEEDKIKTSATSYAPPAPHAAASALGRTLVQQFGNPADVEQNPETPINRVLEAIFKAFKTDAESKSDDRTRQLIEVGTEEYHFNGGLLSKANPFSVDSSNVNHLICCLIAAYIAKVGKEAHIENTKTSIAEFCSEIMILSRQTAVLRVLGMVEDTNTKPITHKLVNDSKAKSLFRIIWAAECKDGLVGALVSDFEDLGTATEDLQQSVDAIHNWLYNNEQV
jgi:hypothetical protein